MPRRKNKKNATALLNQKEKNTFLENRLKHEWEEFSPESTLSEKKSGDIFSNVLSEIEREEKSATKKRFSQAFIIQTRRIAAVLLFGLITSLTFLLLNNQENLQQDEEIVHFETLNGQTKKINLPDGTTVFLNSGSRITFNNTYNGDNREVKLQGEAYFKVKRDTTKPFLVKTNDITTKVLGTEFNVNAYGDDNKLSVTVKHGKVAVFRKQQPENKILLTEKQKTIFHRNSGNLQKVTTNNLNELAWINGGVVFDNIPLTLALKRLEREHNVNFTLKNPTIGNCLIKGAFENEPIMHIVEMLSMSLNFDYSTDSTNRTIIINGDGCQVVNNKKANVRQHN